jgi:hypothetical protein
MGKIQKINFFPFPFHYTPFQYSTISSNSAVSSELRSSNHLDNFVLLKECDEKFCKKPGILRKCVVISVSFFLRLSHFSFLFWRLHFWVHLWSITSSMWDLKAVNRVYVTSSNLNLLLSSGEGYITAGSHLPILSNKSSPHSLTNSALSSALVMRQLITLILTYINFRKTASCLHFLRNLMSRTTNFVFVFNFLID